MSTEFLDVFDFENKIRHLISQLVSPALQKLEENQADIHKLKKKSDKQGDRLGKLESSQERLLKKAQTIDDVSARINSLRVEKNNLKSTTDSKFESFNSELEKFDYKISEILTRVGVYEKTEKKNKENINELKEAFKKAQESVYSNSVSLNNKVTTKINSFREKFEEFGGTVEDLKEQMKELRENAMPQLSAQVENSKRIIRDSKENIESIAKQTLTKRDLKKLENRLYDEVDQLSKSFKQQNKQLRDSHQELQNYLKNSLPQEENLRVTEMLLRVADNQLLKNLVETQETKFENCLYEESSHLKSQIETIKQLVQEGREKLDKLEQEKQEKQLQKQSINAKRKRSPSKSPQRTLEPLEEGSDSSELDGIYSELNEIKENLTKFTEETEEAFRRFSTDLEAINQSLLANEDNLKDLTSNTKQELQKNSMTLKQEFYTNIELIRDEVQQLFKKSKNQRGALKQQMLSKNEEFQKEEHRIIKLETEIKNVSDLVLKVTEFCKLVNTLLEKEEEDKEAMQLMGYTEKGKPSNKTPVSIDPNCMSCSGNSSAVIQCFKLACLSYSSSPVKYRYRTYSRKQFTKMLGSFMESALTHASSGPPFDCLPLPLLVEESSVPPSSHSSRRKTRRGSRHILDLSASSRVQLDLTDISPFSSQRHASGNF